MLSLTDDTALTSYQGAIFSLYTGWHSSPPVSIASPFSVIHCIEFVCFFFAAGPAHFIHSIMNRVLTAHLQGGGRCRVQM